MNDKNDETRDDPGGFPPVAHTPPTTALAERFKVVGPCGQSEFDALRSAALIAQIDKDSMKPEAQFRRLQTKGKPKGEDEP